ncbi:MAG: methionine--tRNA ligase subunit beta [Candidatus Omnitrophota bacterium]
MMPLIKFEDFKKLDLKTAKVLKVDDHPNADKLYVLTVGVGDSEKKIVAGIKPYYKPEELFGRMVIIIDNLEPANIRGVESCGMLLAAKDDKTLAILAPDKGISEGSRVS